MKRRRVITLLVLLLFATSFLGTIAANSIVQAPFTGTDANGTFYSPAKVFPEEGSLVLYYDKGDVAVLLYHDGSVETCYTSFSAEYGDVGLGTGMFQLNEFGKALLMSWGEYPADGSTKPQFAIVAEQKGDVFALIAANVGACGAE